MRRLTILIATVGALLLVPIAQAFASELSVKVVGTGSGEVTSVGGAALIGPGFEEFVGFYEGEPPIECSYEAPGPATGVCENEMSPGDENHDYVVLKPVPDPGSVFIGWKTPLPASGQFQCQEAVGQENVNEEYEACLVTAPPGQEVEAIARFGKAGPPLTLNVEEGSGTVVSNPAGLQCSKSAGESCITEKIEAGKVTLTASPAPGYLLKSWKGCDTGGVNGRQCTVTLAEPGKTVGVKFYKVWNLEASKSSGQGIFSSSPGGVNCGYGCLASSADYKEGSLTLKAKPAKNFHFVEFTGGTGAAESCNEVTEETCTIPSFNQDSAIEEVYAENAKHTLRFTKEGGGQGFIKTKPTNINCGYTCDSAEAEFFASEEVPVTVTLNKGTTSIRWINGNGTTCTEHVLTCTVPMSEDHALIAEFN